MLEFTIEHKVTDVTLYRSALEYLNVINITQKSEDSCPQTPFCFIAALTTELALKAFLTNRGVPENTSKNIGHNLVRAWSKSVEMGLQVDPEVPRWCDLLNGAYDRPFLARYARTNTGIVSSPQHELHEALNNLVSTVGNQLGLDLNGNFV